jgi:predicted RNase H-like HicB family nuclease
MSADSDPQITLEKADDGTFLATSSSLPGYVAHGETENAAVRKIKKALKLHFKEEERDFERLAQRGESPDEAFRWSRYRAPLYLSFPLSRNVKLTLAAFGAGLLLGLSTYAYRRRRRG